MRCVVSVVLFLLLGACVFLSDEGKKVRVLTAQEVGRCENLGTVTSRVQAGLGGLRPPNRVAEDLTRNAQNAAAERKADTLVPLSEIKEGEQTFGLYRCL